MNAQDVEKLGPKATAGITVGDLARQLRSYPQDAELYFGGLQFYRLKQRGGKLVQLEFNQLVGRDEKGRLFAEDVV